MPSSSSSPDPASKRGLAGVVGIAVALVVIAGAAWYAVQVAGADDTPEFQCETTTLTMMVAPAMEDLVEQSLAALEDNGQCIEFDMSVGTVADVVEAQADAEGEEVKVLPDLWVPDSPGYKRVLRKAELTGRIVNEALATSPVGFATGGPSTKPASWLSVLQSNRLIISDPQASGASAYALLTPYSEDPTPAGAEAAAEAIRPIAQRYGDQVAKGELSTTNIDNILAGDPKLIPVTEQDYLTALRGNPTLTWTAPKTGEGLLRYPIVAPYIDGTSMDLGSSTVDLAGRTADRIAAWFSSEEGLAALDDEHLRNALGEPFPEEEGVDAVNLIQQPADSEVTEVMNQWSVLTVPSSILVLVDSSASMGTALGGLNRSEVVRDASLTALSVLPDNARVGTTIFSTSVGGRGADYEVLVPMRRLDARAGGRPHSELLADSARSLPSRLGGSASLYDAVLASYQEATREYNPAYFNTLAIFTGTANDDPESISLKQLMSEIEALYDPERPVRLLPIGIGPDADMDALQQLAELTNTEAWQASSPEDVLTVLAQTQLSREE